MPRAEILIVGAGPAGLAAAACLRQRGLEAVLLERGTGVGESWRRHYERLHLHTVKELSALPGMPWGGEVPRYPSRLQVVDYLERYADRFGLAPRLGVEVTAARALNGGAPAGGDGHAGWLLDTSEGSWETRRLVVASGFNALPFEPGFPGREEFRGSVEHSSTYRSGAPWSGRPVLVVGIGNSGAEIALDLCEHGAHATLAVRGAQYAIPRDFLGMPSQKSSVRLAGLPLGVRDAIARTISRLAFGDLSRYGIRRPELGPISRVVLERKVPLLDVGTVARIRSGEIAVAPGVERFTATGVTFTDGSERPFDHVVLATGYRTGLDRWIDGIGAALDAQGIPLCSGDRLLPGLYALGFANTVTGLLLEISREAPRLAARIAAGSNPTSPLTYRER